MMRFALAGTFMMLALAAAAGAQQPSLDAPQVVQTAAAGVTATLNYTLQPSQHPHAEDDSGPILKDGMLTISGPKSSASTFAFADLGMLLPNLGQAIETDPAQSCGSAGPLAIEPLKGSLFPSVVVTSVIVEKGCLPVVHVFVPVDDRSDRYQRVIVYTLDHPIQYPRGVRVIPPISTGGLRVKRVRDVVLVNPKADSPWTIEVVDGTDTAGAPLTIAIDRPDPQARPEVGETLSIFARGPASGWTVRLSSEHEGRYRSLNTTN